MPSPQRQIPLAEYTVGWICALPIETAASIALLDELYTPPAQPPHDQNSYSFGRIGKHNIVVVCLPAGVIGTASAATVAAQLRSTFPLIQYGLLVGVGGGAPSAKNDIRLGDVVVSKPTGNFGGVVQYDFGKTIEKGIFKQTGSLNKPPRVLLSALASLETKCHLQGNRLTSASLVIPDTYSELRSVAKYPGTDHDRLYETECDHGRDPETCEVCDEPRCVDRPSRRNEDPVIHFGLIASANQVMRHGITRENLRKELDVLCFEMEAAGLMDNLPCLVVRGICDYADSHKTKQWQPYAAVTAAACVKQILLHTPVIIGEKAITTGDAAPSMAWLSAFNGFMFQNIRNYRFSGRSTELVLLDTWYSGDVDSARGQSTQMRTVIHGLGGVGKTQLVTEWCHRLRERSHTSVFWFNAASSEELMSKYQQYARRHRELAATDNNVKRFVDAHDKEKDDIALVKVWVQVHENWVIVLDNYDTISVDVEPFLPKSFGRIVITSRDRRAIGTVSNRGFELKRPQSAEAELLFLRLSCPQKDVTAKNIGEHPEYNYVKEIVSDLEGFPLAISQAAAYIRESEPLSCAEYLEILRSRSDREVLLRFKEERPEYPESVMTTWEISWVYLTKKHPEAAELLQLLGFFAPSGVAEGMLHDSLGTRSWRFESYAKVRQLNSKQRDELSFLQSRAQTTISLGILISLSLVSKSSDKVVSVHPLVHEWIQARLKPNPMESLRVLRLCSLILYQAFPFEVITFRDLSRFPDVPTFTPHLLEMLTVLQQSRQVSEPLPLELKTLLLAHLLIEVTQDIESRTTQFTPLIVRVFPSTMSNTEEPLDAIQNQLFEELRGSDSLWHTETLSRAMKVLQLSLSNYSSAPPWIPSRKIYMVVLVTFVLKMFETWLSPTGHLSEILHSVDGLYPKTERDIVFTLYKILSFLSLETDNTHNEILFLQVRVKLVLAQIITIDKYLKLPQHFFRDGISWEQVSCVDFTMQIEYLAACAKFSRPYPKDTTNALLLAAKALRESGQSNNHKSGFSAPFVSNSFGRDIELYFELYAPELLGTSVIEASKALGEACLKCSLAVLNSLESRKTVSLVNERDTGISLLGLLRAWEELKSLIEIRIKVYSGGGEGSFLFESDEQRFEFERLYVNACFLRADYSSAVPTLHKLFQVKKVMARFKYEYNNPRRFLFGQQDGANVKNTTFMMPFLSFLYGPIWKKTVKHQLPRPGLNGFRHQGYLDNCSNGSNVKEQAAAWYANGSRLRNLDVTKDLLRIWIDCLGHLGNAHERDRHAWQDEVDAIPRIHSAETIVVVYSLAKASIPTMSRSSPWRQTIDYLLAGTDENSESRDDSRTVNFSLSIPEAKDNVHGNDDLIFGEMELE